MSANDEDDDSFIVLGSSPPLSKPLTAETFPSTISENVMLRATLSSLKIAQRSRLTSLEALLSDFQHSHQTNRQRLTATGLLVHQLRSDNAALRNQLKQLPAVQKLQEESSSHLSVAQTELAQLRLERDERDACLAQLQLYREDFELERSSRARLAGEKESAEAALQHALAHNQQLMRQLELVRELEPELYSQIISQKTDAGVVPVVAEQILRCPLCERHFERFAQLRDHAAQCQP